MMFCEDPDPEGQGVNSEDPEGSGKQTGLHALSVFAFVGLPEALNEAGAFFLGHPCKAFLKGCQGVTGGFCVRKWTRRPMKRKRAVRAS